MLTTVKSVKPTGKAPYEGQNGLLYSFNYEFADGSALLVNHKTAEARFKAGDPVDYTITKTSKFGNIGKVDRPKDGTTPTPNHQPISQISNLQAEHGGETQLDRIERKLDELLDQSTFKNEPF